MKKILFAIVMLAVTVPVFAADWTTAMPVSGSNVSDFPAQTLANNAFLDRLLSYYRAGMQVSYTSATAVSVAAGEVTCTNSGTAAHVFRQNTVATSVGWADIDTGTEAISTTYYVYANCDAAATTVTFKLSTSSTTPTGVTTFRRLGSFYNDASGDIRKSSIVNDDVAGAVTSYDSGWFAVSTGATYTKTHNLGTTKVLYTIYFSPDSAGATSYLYSSFREGSANAVGLMILPTDTTFVVNTGGLFSFYSTPYPAYTNYTSGYLRIIATTVN